MNTPSPLALFFIIALEGYVVLSSELLAIRQIMPFVGSGTDTVSIIIAAVLMPLAFGYQSGGKFQEGEVTRFGKSKYISVKDKLQSNILVASVFLLFGLSYIFMGLFFDALNSMGIQHRLLMTAIYSGLFLVIPVYLLGQTIPLCSNYFSKEKLPQVTGKILFFSTMGSFFGAIFSTLVLMSTIGVHHTVTINFALLSLLVFLLTPQLKNPALLMSLFMLYVSIQINSERNMDMLHIVKNNTYNTIAVQEDKDGTRRLIMNNNLSSQYHENGTKNAYINRLESLLLHSIPEGSEKKDILVIGAGAFTFGREDTYNNYDFVDIDKDLKPVAENDILKGKLHDNVTFYPLPARGFLSQNSKKYDIILLDAYYGDLTIPEQLVTQEFFLQVKGALADDGIVAANFIAASNFTNAFSQRIHNTFTSVFSPSSRILATDAGLWQNDPHHQENVLYIYKNIKPIDGIYTDNKNRIFLDKSQKR